MNTVDSIPQNIMDSVEQERAIETEEQEVTTARTVQTQFNVHVWGKLHGLVLDTYHKVYDLGDDATSVPKSLADARVLFSKDFQSVTHAFLESSITTTELLQ